jgi:hypothetical protein
MLESPRLTNLYSSIKSGSLPPFLSLSLTIREVNLIVKTYSLGDVEPRLLENQGQHPFWNMHFIT